MLKLILGRSSILLGVTLIVSVGEVGEVGEVAQVLPVSAEMCAGSRGATRGS